jgi:protein SCO1/2
MTSNMKPLEKFFFNDPLVSLLSFSVTPWIDGPNKLKNYAKFYDINSSNWIFLTGSKSKIYELARKSYFAEEDFGFSKDSTEFLHSEYFILVDNNKNIRGVYNGTLKLEVEQLEKDIIELKASL